MKTSIIIPFSGRDNERVEALCKLMDCLKAQDWYIRDAQNNPIGKDYQIILVEQHLSSKRAKPLPDRVTTVVGKHIEVHHERFNKSWLMNVGAKYSDGNYLLFIDSDMMFAKEYLDKLNRWHKKNFFPMVIAWDEIIKLPGKDDPVIRYVDRDKTQTAGGAWQVEKIFFWNCGGMNENYFEYGGEDNDFWMRAYHMSGKNIRYFPYTLIHNYHPVAEPNPDRFFFMDRTNQHRDQVIKRLTDQSEFLGSTGGPTAINMDDLHLTEPGIAEPGSRGIIV